MNLQKLDPLEGFKPTISMLKIFSVWNSSNMFYKIYKNVTTLSLAITYTCVMICVVVNFNVSEINENFYYIPALSTAPFKLVIFQKSFKKIQNLLFLLQSQYTKIRSEKQAKMVEDSVVLSKRVVKVFAVLVVPTCVGLFGMPLLKDEIKLPLIIWIPFDYHEPVVFGLVYFVISFSGSFTAYINIGTDTFFYNCLIQIETQCNILSDTLRNLHEFGRFEAEIHTILIECIEQYKTILKFTKILSKTYQGILSVQFICSLLSLCLTMYRMSLADPGSEEFLRYFVFQWGVLPEIFLYCYFGHRVLDSTKNLYYSTYELQWYNTSAKFKTNLLIFMGQIQNPIVIYVAGIFSLDLETFKKIMQKAWSFFTALRNIHEQ
ncbi:odorant receptor 54 [Tribolium castaneum]|uniref:Odorant receptor n=1 Tax=Tribolium castaneum TaxID=7070 RepID=D6X4J8_TRICA|nr:PREDICTED: odorant receptor 4 [Tribolium castaneum]EEZ97743.1 odorant receptor 54 [Tribolium castaneum]|eukprot:XP_969312.2 PREDICTED: odorant receptor 4 [Tribolium castaneum]